MLSDPAVRNAKPNYKPYKLHDERGLYLLVMPSGGRWWRLDFRVNAKRKTLSLGTYPDIGLKDARIRRDEARKQLAAGIDPSAARKAEKAVQGQGTFEAITLEWHTKRSQAWDPKHALRVLRSLRANVFPWVGPRQIQEITPPDLLAILRNIEGRGRIESAHRVHQYLSQVFRYAIATGRAERDQAADLKGALPPVKVTNRAAVIEPRAVGELLRTIEGYQGTLVTQCALRLAPVVFVRPGELRRAEWSEINLEAAEWRIPAQKTKMRSAHVVPLSRQALAILHELHGLTGRGRYIFPSERTRDRPMSENTINAALRRLGYGRDEMCGHGFRALASTLLNEQGWNRDVIERQLAHAERSKVRAAYNRAEHLPDRRRMMQAWADYLDSLKNGAEVVLIKGKALIS